MNDIHECTCGMPTIWTPCFPEPYSLEWHMMHRKVHVATFPEADAVTVANLDLFIEFARDAKELCDA